MGQAKFLGDDRIPGSVDKDLCLGIEQAIGRHLCGAIKGVLELALIGKTFCVSNVSLVIQLGIDTRQPFRRQVLGIGGAFLRVADLFPPILGRKPQFHLRKLCRKGLFGFECLLQHGRNFRTSLDRLFPEPLEVTNCLLAASLSEIADGLVHMGVVLLHRQWGQRLFLRQGEIPRNDEEDDGDRAGQYPEATRQSPRQCEGPGTGDVGHLHLLSAGGQCHFSSGWNGQLGVRLTFGRSHGRRGLGTGRSSAADRNDFHFRSTGRVLHIPMIVPHHEPRAARPGIGYGRLGHTFVNGRGLLFLRIPGRIRHGRQFGMLIHHRLSDHRCGRRGLVFGLGSYPYLAGAQTDSGLQVGFLNALRTKVGAVLASQIADDPSALHSGTFEVSPRQADVGIGDIAAGIAADYEDSLRKEVLSPAFGALDDQSHGHILTSSFLPESC